MCLQRHSSEGKFSCAVHCDDHFRPKSGLLELNDEVARASLQLWCVVLADEVNILASKTLVVIESDVSEKGGFRRA